LASEGNAMIADFMAPDVPLVFIPDVPFGCCANTPAASTTVHATAIEIRLVAGSPN
jgi:hypothetical protein